jgi:hypothetical protein
MEVWDRHIVLNIQQNRNGLPMMSSGWWLLLVADQALHYARPAIRRRMDRSQDGFSVIEYGLSFQPE